MNRTIVAGVIAGLLSVIGGRDQADARTITGNASVPYWFNDSNGNPLQKDCFNEFWSEAVMTSRCPNPGNVPLVTPLPVDGAGWHSVTWVLDGVGTGDLFGFQQASCFAVAFAPFGVASTAWWSASVAPNVHGANVQSLTTSAYVGNGANLESECFLPTAGMGLRMVNYNP
jgi:hypothetical protein